MKRMPIGIEDFRELIEENYYFIDKTDFIRQLIDEHDKVTLITRPRRFGKTLTMNMLYWFFAKQKEAESRHLFQELTIAKAGETYMSQRGQYPVLFLTLKDIDGLKWEDMLDSFRTAIRNWTIEYEYLTESDSVSQSLKDRFSNIVQNGQGNAAETANALFLIISMMYQHYGKKVILLLDEYDAPIEKAWERGFYDQCIAFMKLFLGTALKTNPFLDFAVLTGVLRVAKESIFSGLNNLSVCTIMDHKYADIFGFTSAEIAKMAKDLGKEQTLKTLQYWYDGYRFSNLEIYNPWSVINFFDNGEARAYWVNTSSNGIIRHMLKHLDAEKEDVLRSLLHGGSITVSIREGIIYQNIDQDEDALYTMLLTTGYLTARSQRYGIGGLIGELAIPNREIQDVFRVEILDHFKGGLSITRLEFMLNDLITGQAADFEKRLSTYIRYLVSSYDVANKESFYHGFLLGMTALFVPDYIVESNRESGYGRFDLAIFPKNSHQAGVIMEFKAADSAKQLDSKAKEALAQIRNRQYITEFSKRSITQVWIYGIAFYRKEVCVKGSSVQK